MMMKIKDISKIYDELTESPTYSLKKVSLEIRKKDFLCVMGPSGSGKTTFINCISTIDTPTSGDVIIEGQSIHEMSEKDMSLLRNKDIGFIFQDYQLIDYLTIQENILFPLSLQGKNDLNKVKDISKKLGIEDVLYKYPNECSGGQKERAGIARALVSHPRLIIADEPTGNLDSQNTYEMLNMLKNLNEEENVTIIMVTHDPLVASYSSRLIYIQDGMLKEEMKRSDYDTQENYFHEIMRLNSQELLQTLQSVDNQWG